MGLDSYGDWIHTDDAAEELRSDEDFLGNVIEALRKSSSASYADQNEVIGIAIHCDAMAVHEAFLDKLTGDQMDSAESASTVIDLGNSSDWRIAT